MRRRLEDVQGAHGVHPECLGRLAPRVAHVGERRQVVDDVRLCRLQVGCEEDGIGHVHLGAGGDGRVAGIGEVAEKPGADKARSSGQIRRARRSG